MEIAEVPIVRMTPDGRMFPDGAAIYTGMSEKTLAAWRSAGKGPRFVKVGRVFYFKSDLDEWLADARANSTAQAANASRAAARRADQDGAQAQAKVQRRALAAVRKPVAPALADSLDTLADAPSAASSRS